MMRKKNRIGAIVPDVNCEVRSQLAMVSIAHTLYAQLNWSQYKLLISIDDAQEREYYQLEAVNHCWTKRELERQIHSQLWERLCLSNDKEAVLAVARKERIPETPQEIIKDPMRLEFLGLEKKAKYYESDLEQAIIDHLQGKRSAESATTASSSLTARKCSGKCAEETHMRFAGEIRRRQTRRAPKRPRCVAQPSWQEVFRVFIPRQVKYSRHTGEDITGRGKRSLTIQ